MTLILVAVIVGVLAIMAMLGYLAIVFAERLTAMQEDIDRISASVVPADAGSGALDGQKIVTTFPSRPTRYPWSIVEAAMPAALQIVRGDGHPALRGGKPDPGRAPEREVLREQQPKLRRNEGHFGADSDDT